jgi:hypothetical protein
MKGLKVNMNYVNCALLVVVLILVVVCCVKKPTEGFKLEWKEKEHRKVSKPFGWGVVENVPDDALPSPATTAAAAEDAVNLEKSIIADAPPRSWRGGGVNDALPSSVPTVSVPSTTSAPPSIIIGETEHILDSPHLVLNRRNGDDIEFYNNSSNNLFLHLDSEWGEGGYEFTHDDGKEWVSYYIKPNDSFILEYSSELPITINYSFNIRDSASFGHVDGVKTTQLVGGMIKLEGYCNGVPDPEECADSRLPPCNYPWGDPISGSKQHPNSDKVGGLVSGVCPAKCGKCPTFSACNGVYNKEGCTSCGQNAQLKETHRDFSVKKNSNGAPAGCIYYNKNPSNKRVIWVDQCKNHPNCKNGQCSGCKIL